MAAFTRWFATNGYQGIQERLQERVLALRAEWTKRSTNRRTPAAVAELQAGFELFLEFAADAGAITAEKRAELERRAVVAFAQALALQSKYQAAADPAVRFGGLLKTALLTSQAHVADRRGLAPKEAQAWGWQGYAAGWEVLLSSSTAFQAQPGRRWLARSLCFEPFLRWHHDSKWSGAMM